jgi:hypothetical protein
MLTLAMLSCAAPAGAASASPYEYGEVLRFGGFASKTYDNGKYDGKPEQGEFLDPTGFAVDPVDNAVYVVERTSVDNDEPTTAWRIQQFKPSGALEGETTFTLQNTNFHAYAIAGLAVDHLANRLYALVVGNPPLGGSSVSTPVAQELLAWSTKPEGEKLVAPTGLAPDPLDTTGGLVSGKSQLDPAGGRTLYGPEGIAIDRLEISGVDNPVVIEASDLIPGVGKGAPIPGDTIVQQVATQPQGATQTGELLASWSGASVAATLHGSWGPHGIFDDPDGTLSVLLDGDHSSATDEYVVRLEPNLSGAVVVNSDADAPNSSDYDEASLWGGDEAPFNSPAGAGISDIYGAGPEVAQLSTVSGGADGLYAADIISDEQFDHQFAPESTGPPEYWTEGEPEEGTKPNIGVRLLQPEADGVLANSRGGTIVNTLGNKVPGEPCNIGAAEATLAAGADGTLWVLARGPESITLLSKNKAVRGREVIELAPRAELPTGDEKLCPQPSGTFTMSAPGELSQSAEGPPLEVPAGTQVTFDAGSIMVKSEPIETGKTGKPFAYEWNFESAAGEPFTALKIERMQPPNYYFPSAAIKHTYTRPGTYTVTARLLSDYGAYTTTSGTVVVTHDPNGGPRPQFTTASAGNQQIAFDASGSMPGTGTIVHYTWNWGDGTPLEGEEAQAPAVTHAYATPGIYQVTLTVTNSAYQSATSAPRTVIVEATPSAVSVLSGPLYAIPPAPLYEIPGLPPGKRSFDLAAHARFARGAIEVKLSCPKGAGTCAGAVQAQTASRFAIAAGRARRGGHTAKPRRLSLGQAAFHLAAGRQATVTVRVSAQGLVLLRKLKRLTVLVNVTARDGAGEQGAQTLRLALSAPASDARAHSHKHR